MLLIFDFIELDKVTIHNFVSWSQGLWIHLFYSITRHNVKVGTSWRMQFLGWSWGSCCIWKCLETVIVGIEWRSTFPACSLSNLGIASLQTSSTLYFRWGTVYIIFSHSFVWGKVYEGFDNFYSWICFMHLCSRSMYRFSLAFQMVRFILWGLALGSCRAH